jgi:hypothetical protein
MKNIFKLGVITFVLIIGISFTACEFLNCPDCNELICECEENSDTNLFLGSWSFIEPSGEGFDWVWTFTFNTDNTFTYIRISECGEFGLQEMSGTYTHDGNSGTLTYLTGHPTPGTQVDAVITGNTIIINNGSPFTKN